MVLISAYARMVSSRMEINVFKQLLQEKFFNPDIFKIICKIRNFAFVQLIK